MSLLYYIIPVPSTGAGARQRAFQISRRLYRVSRPTEAANPEDVTEFNYPVIIHPVDGRVAIEIDDEDFLPISPLKNSQQWISIFPGMSNQERDRIRDEIQNNRGVPSFNLLPNIITGSLLNRQQMEAQGWFPQN